MTIKNLLILSVIVVIAINALEYEGEQELQELMQMIPDETGQLLERIRSDLKYNIHNTQFRHTQFLLMECCHTVIIWRKLKNGSADIKRCGGKRLNEALAIYDTMLDELVWYLKEANRVTWKTMDCNTDECIDFGIDKLRFALLYFEKVVGDEISKIVKMYLEEDGSVKECVINGVLTSVAVEFIQVEREIGNCFDRSKMRPTIDLTKSWITNEVF